MGIALFHLMPESAESFDDYYNQTDPDSKWKKLPNAFFIAFISYSLILLIEKVAFDSHSLTDHDHGGHEHAEHHSHKEKDDLSEYLLEGHNDTDQHKNEDVKLENSKQIHPNDATNYIFNNENTVETRDRQNSKVSASSDNKLSVNKKYSMCRKRASIDEELSKIKEKGYEEESDHEGQSEDDIDLQEETLKNVVSSKGKFASYLHSRNICNFYLTKCNLLKQLELISLFWKQV